MQFNVSAHYDNFVLGIITPTYGFEARNRNAIRSTSVISLALVLVQCATLLMRYLIFYEVKNIRGWFGNVMQKQLLFFFFFLKLLSWSYFTFFLAESHWSCSTSHPVCRLLYSYALASTHSDDRRSLSSALVTRRFTSQDYQYGTLTFNFSALCLD